MDCAAQEIPISTLSRSTKQVQELTVTLSFFHTPPVDVLDMARSGTADDGRQRGRDRARLLGFTLRWSSFRVKKFTFSRFLLGTTTISSIYIVSIEITASLTVQQAYIKHDKVITMRIAVVGCSHGTLDDIYASVERCDQEAKKRDEPPVDLMICCGDFQVSPVLFPGQMRGGEETRREELNDDAVLVS